MKADLTNWSFLIGKWKGENIESSYDEGNVTMTGEYQYKPNDKFIHHIHEAQNEDGPINNSIAVMYIDPYSNRFLRKEIYSYGFVNNEVSYHFGENSIKFDITIEPHPKQFEGLVWRSWLTKISDTEIEMAMENRKEDQPYQLFNRSRWQKILK
ncbi:MAG: hypothetical protein ACXAB7_03370 [Candidatus Kariarchaeaceae archaeon]|jgi:hypothetical protein